MKKKVNAKTFAEITIPLKKAINKSSLKEKDVLNIIKKVRNN